MVSLRAAASGLALVLLLGSAVQGGPAATVTVKSPGVAEATVDLHAICEALLRSCDGLDPAAFGMAPAEALLPDGSWPGLAVAEHEKLHLRVLGVKAKLHVEAEASTDAEAAEEDSTGPPPVPCADAPDCPDLLVDAAAMAASARLDLRTFDAASCAVAEGSTEPGERRLLRFDFTSPNMGAGDLEIGRPADHPEWFTWGACHGHWHFAEYADYRLWDVAGYAAWQFVRAAHPSMPPEQVLELYPELRDHMLAGHKQGFCVIDILPWSPVTTHRRQFRLCDENQGITVDWADKYSLFLDGQWIDVTGLAPGAYVLEAEVNPERLYVESDYSNNAAAVLVAIP